MSVQRIPVGSILIRDYWSGLFVTGIALGWFLIGGWAILGALLVGYGSSAGSELPTMRAFAYLSVYSVAGGTIAWLRFRIVFRTFLTGVKTKGVLVAAHHGGGSAKLKSEYVHESTTCQAVTRVYGVRLLEVGETVEVVYDPTTPSRAYVWEAYVPGKSSAQVYQED